MQKYDFVIAADHAGVKLKKKIIEYLQQKKITILDLGTNSDSSVDYPDFANKVLESMSEDIASRGILICGTGIGMSMAANRRSLIRAALCVNEYMAEKSRTHNNANVLVLGSKLIKDNLSIKIVDKFINTSFEGGRHSKRLGKIS